MVSISLKFTLQLFQATQQCVNSSTQLLYVPCIIGWYLVSNRVRWSDIAVMTIIDPFRSPPPTFLPRAQS